MQPIFLSLPFYEQETKQTESVPAQQQVEVRFFKTSGTPQPPELKKFFEEKLAIPYNKYCLDCKKNTTTHCIVWLGIFLCRDCAEIHSITFGGNQYSYVKDVYGEQWDDYQLRSVCLGGNQPLFNLLKEYQIDGHPIASKYRHAAVTWYRKRLITLMDGLQFDIDACPKPPKDWDERMAQTKQTLLKTKDLLTRDISKAGS